MELELWSNKEDEYGFIVDEFNVKQRVYLENHWLLEGVDVTEVETLNTIYVKELFKMNTIDIKEALFKVSRDWFNIIPYINRYINLSDCIIFNIKDSKFELLNDDYTSYAERYIESYTEDSNPIILGEFEFDIRRQLNLEEGLAIKVENYKEEHLYKIKECDNYLLIKSDLTADVKKGIIIGKSAANCLLNNNGSNIILGQSIGSE